MPDFTGDLGGKVAAAESDFAAKLTAISDKILAAAPGIEQPAIDALHADIAALVAAETAAISQAGAELKGDLAPLAAEWARTNDFLDKVAALIDRLATPSSTIT